MGRAFIFLALLVVPMCSFAQEADAPALARDARLNVVDSAIYQIAEIHLSNRKYADAVAALEQLAKTTNDSFTLSLTYLNIGDIQRIFFAQQSKAAEAYLKVTGELADLACERIARMYEELDQVDEAAKVLKKTAAETKDSLQKYGALNSLAQLCLRNGRNGEALDALKLIAAIPRDEAANITKKLQAERQRRAENKEQKQ